MNFLSWILYLADVSESLKGWLQFFAVLATFAVFIAAMCVAFIMSFISEAKGKNGNHKEEIDFLTAVRDGLFKTTLRYSVPIFLVMFLLGAFIPSKQTFMLIAASEVGEDVILSPAAGEVGEVAMDSLRLLKDYINKQLEPAAPASTSN